MKIKPIAMGIVPFDDFQSGLNSWQKALKGETA